MTTRSSYWSSFVPKLVTLLRRGYGVDDLRHDAQAGLTVAIVALPLAMALAIASGAPPEKGLHTAIVAGFLISAFGGSRVQIGGPTAAFVPLVFNVIDRFGYGGLLLCTLLAGLLLIAAGLLRLGTLLKYMPRPVITGFTAGIAVSIALSQVKDALGLEMGALPAEFIPRLRALGEHLGTTNGWAIAMTLAAIATIVALRRWRPAIPGFLVVVVIGAVVASVAGEAIDTIGSRFGGIPAALPAFALSDIPFARVGELLPSAFAIAFLAGIESLLSAVVADGMTGGRHRSNVELVAQGIANVASAVFGGLPATGALARTATNVRAGARTPVAGMLHAVFLLGFMLLLAPLMRHVPLPVLAAVLLVVAWNMAELHHFRLLLRGPFGDRAVLLLTFALTVAFDLVVAVEVGVVLAAFLFMHRMADAVALNSPVSLIERDDADDGAPDDQLAQLPAGVAAFQIAGPLFFAVAGRLDDVLDLQQPRPHVFILRLRLVPFIDASGVLALGGLLDRAQKLGIRVILSGLQAQPRAVLAQMHILEHPAFAAAVPDFAAAIAHARAVALDAALRP
jgi:sulfate permease, SulP family